MLASLRPTASQLIPSSANRRRLCGRVKPQAVAVLLQLQADRLRRRLHVLHPLIGSFPSGAEIQNGHPGNFRAISLRNWRRFPYISASVSVKPVTFPP